MRASAPSTRLSGFTTRQEAQRGPSSPASRTKHRHERCAGAAVPTHTFRIVYIDAIVSGFQAEGNGMVIDRPVNHIVSHIVRCSRVVRNNDVARSGTGLLCQLALPACLDAN